MAAETPAGRLTASVFEGLLHQTFQVCRPLRRIATGTAGFEAGINEAIAGVGGWDAATTAIDLVEVTRHPRLKRNVRSPAGDPEEAFVLLFRASGERGEPLASSLHRVAHPAVGEFLVFLSPVVLPPGESDSHDAQRLHYEAVFA